ncbi:hypothetical protein OCB07_04410 [Bacillus cereus]|nr:hypothetical protein [Bacillus cereus]
MDKHYVDKRVTELENQVWGLNKTVADLSTTVSMLSEVVKTKANKDDIQLLIKQSEVVKKINESEPIGTDCKVSINLDGKVIAESIDSIKCRAIKE